MIVFNDASYGNDISGFHVITPRSPAGFYARRARRILPAATLVLLVVVAYAGARLPPPRVAALNEDVLWSALFLANVHLAQANVDYFMLDEAPSAVQHYWSLAVEEQFYLVWPVLLLLMVALRRGSDHRSATALAASRVRLVAGVVVVVWCASLSWSLLLTGRSPNAAYFSSLTRVWELATGVLLALGSRHLHALRSSARHALAAGGLLLVVAAAVAYDDTTPFPGWQALLPVLGTAAVLAAGTGSEPAGASRVLTWRPLPWIGDVSYSLYLWHWPVLILGARHVGSTRSAAETVVMLAIVLTAATASYYLVENPVRHSRRILGGRRRALVLWPVALSLVAVSTALSTQHADRVLQARTSQVVELPGVPAGQARGDVRTDLRTVTRRLDDALRRASAHAPIPFPLDNYDHLGRDLFLRSWRCFADWEASTADICPLGDASSDRTVVLFGDSFMEQWLAAFDEIGRREELRIVPLIKLGCGPYDVAQQHRDDDYPSCPAFREWATRQIASMDPDLVVVGGRGLFHVVPDDGQTPEQAWSDGVESALRRLQPLAELEVLSSTTPMEFSPWDCLAAPDADMGTCTSPMDSLELDANRLTEAVADRLGVRYVDVTGLTCRRGRCPLVVDRVIIRHDAAHITATWAAQTTDALAALLDLETLVGR